MSVEKSELPATAPVAFFIFNRPDPTAEVFAEIRRAKPSRLYVVADGPRTDRPNEAQLCEATRKIVANVDWPCSVFRNYSETNLGCGRRVSSGLDWVFDHEEMAIILEDDCLPDQTFFPFCSELLDRYRDDSRIFSISGVNHAGAVAASKSSYSFTHLPFVWGWATWRRAWKTYDFGLANWNVEDFTELLRSLSLDSILAKHWTPGYQQLLAGKLDTWDLQWTYSSWKNHAFSAIPKHNLIRNIGFSDSATHTHSSEWRAFVPRRPLDFPLIHPGSVELDKPLQASLVARSITPPFSVRSLISRAMKKLSRISYSP